MHVCIRVYMRDEGGSYVRRAHRRSWGEFGFASLSQHTAAENRYFVIPTSNISFVFHSGLTYAANKARRVGAMRGRRAAGEHAGVRRTLRVGACVAPAVVRRRFAYRFVGPSLAMRVTRRFTRWLPTAQHCNSRN